MAKLPDSDAKVVLVVDDDPVLRNRVAKMLTEAGYPVVMARDNEEALMLALKLDRRLGLVLVGSGLSWTEWPPRKSSQT
jgi:CheY-like chemotaxis protein